MFRNRRLERQRLERRRLAKQARAKSMRQKRLELMIDDEEPTLQNLLDSCRSSLSSFKSSLGTCKSSLSSCRSSLDTCKTSFEDELSCPITFNVMEEPVIARDGRTYEREAIEHWIDTNGTSPFTRIVLRKEDLVPNRALKSIIEKK